MPSDVIAFALFVVTIGAMAAWFYWWSERKSGPRR